MNGKTTTGQMMTMMSKQVRKQVSLHTAVWVDQEDKTMNDTKQSSIEWLVEQLKPAITLQEKYINEFLQQAKAMHKEEIKQNVAIKSRLQYITDEEQLKVIDFIMDYSFKDSKEVYTNGTILVPLFRVLDAIEQKGNQYQTQG